MNKGFSLAGIIIAVGIVAVLIFGGYFLNEDDKEGDLSTKEKLDAVEQAENIKEIVEDRNKEIEKELEEELIGFEKPFGDDYPDTSDK